ncbi:hypothetical protein [Micromonospora sp. URMC 103]|uniref:hypothetical protein n=1 Tax=Micromonospora sp. URMC 103 TaxID=3423406 RepID=UPI003F1A2D5E
MRISSPRSGAVLALAVLGTTLGTASPALAAPARADLTADVTVDRSRIPVAGELVETRVSVANAGVATADGFTVTVTLPASAYIGGEGPVADSWQCTAVSPALVCNHPALAAGQSAAPLEFGIQFREGTDGQSGAITASVSSTSREASTRNNSATQTVTYDASVTYPNLRITDVGYIPGSEVIEGDWVKQPLHVTNLGTAAAEDVRVHVVAPTGIFGGVGDQSDPSWQCTTVVAGQEWECVNGPLAPGAQTPVLSFSGSVPAGGQPGDRIPVTYTVSTSTPDEDPRGNVFEGGFLYGTPAYVSGRVWLDADADGQRDADEGAAPTGELSLALQPLGSFQRNVTVNADGTFRAAVHDGDYQLLAGLYSTTHRFTSANAGDDATDSDVTVTYDSPDFQESQSEPFFLAQGDEVVLDIGLVAVG